MYVWNQKYHQFLFVTYNITLSTKWTLVIVRAHTSDCAIFMNNTTSTIFTPRISIGHAYTYRPKLHLITNNDIPQEYPSCVNSFIIVTYYFRNEHHWNLANSCILYLLSCRAYKGLHCDRLGFLLENTYLHLNIKM